MPAQLTHFPSRVVCPPGECVMLISARPASCRLGCRLGLGCAPADVACVGLVPGGLAQHPAALVLALVPHLHHARHAIAVEEHLRGVFGGGGGRGGGMGGKVGLAGWLAVQLFHTGQSMEIRWAEAQAEAQDRSWRHTGQSTLAKACMHTVVEGLLATRHPAPLNQPAAHPSTEPPAPPTPHPPRACHPAAAPPWPCT